MLAQGLDLRGLTQVVQLEHLPSQLFRLWQSRDHLCVQGLDLRRYMHKPHTPLGQGQGAGELPRVQRGSRGSRGQMGTAMGAVFC